MNLPKLKRVLTDPDEFITNSQLKTLALEVLELVPMPGIEGSPLDSGDIMEVVLRAAVGTTSVNGVTTNTAKTPNREPVMDWLHTLDKEPILDAVNDILALLAMSVLDRTTGREPSVSTSWTTRSMGRRRATTKFGEWLPKTAQHSVTGTAQRS